MYESYFISIFLGICLVAMAIEFEWKLSKAKKKRIELFRRTEILKKKVVELERKLSERVEK